MKKKTMKNKKLENQIKNIFDKIDKDGATTDKKIKEKIIEKLGKKEITKN